MIQNKPSALGLQLDRCDICGDKYHRHELVRTQVEFLRMQAENYAKQSSYDSDYWTVDDASDVTSSTVGTYGNRCDNVRLSLDDDNNLTYLNSPKVWEGSGTVRMTDLTSYASESSDLTFSVIVGPHEQNTSPEMTVALGITNSDGSSKQALKTYTTSTMIRAWVNEEIATLGGYGLGDQSGKYWAFRWYFQVTNDGKWWWDEAQLEVSPNRMPNPTAGMPENFVRTSGSNVSNTTEDKLMTQRKVCPGCRETILSKSEKYGRTDQPPVADPVETWNQEI